MPLPGAPQVSQKARPLFLARGTYRQRRLRDAALLLPVLGALLWMIPLLWPRGVDGQLVSVALLYIFGVWASLIGVAHILSRLVREDEDALVPEQLVPEQLEPEKLEPEKLEPGQVDMEPLPLHRPDPVRPAGDS